MEELKTLLKQNHSGKDSFNKIADLLLNSSLLRVNEKQYRFIEIEFYWNNGDDHQDHSTYKRTHVDRLEAGQLFFHYSGFDIVLDNAYGYGGILIRSVYDFSNGKIYKGPMVSCMRIFSGIPVFGGNMSLKLEAAQLIRFSIHTKPKVGVGNNSVKGGFNIIDYNYFIKIGQGKLQG